MVMRYFCAKAQKTGERSVIFGLGGKEKSTFLSLYFLKHLKIGEGNLRSKTKIGVA